MRISNLRFAECRVPLPEVLRLGAISIQTRDYVVLRVETEDGTFGEAIGYVRGTPLFAALQSLAPLILGSDALMRTSLLRRLQGANPAATLALTRALSLVDIACWDILAKSARLPLYRLLGGARETAAATAVAGYYLDRRSPADVADETARLLDAGYDRVKIMLKGDDAAFDEAYVQAVAARAGGRLAADAHWSWTTLTDALAYCRRLEGAGLQFLEDPFPASLWQLALTFRGEIDIPIAIGEDLFGTRTIRDAVNGVDLWRLDATTCGGITGAIEAIHHAAAAGRNVFPHVFAPLHLHLACAYDNVEGVEIIPVESGADPLDQLLDDVPALVGNRLRPREEPGVGISIRWDAAAAFGSRTDDISAPD